MNSHLQKINTYLEKKKNYIFTCIFLILLGFIEKQFIYYLEIKNNKKVTVGKILKYEETIRDYTLYYEYLVDGKIYNGRTSVSYFKDPKKGKLCIDCNFKIYYSSKDPSKSRIYLNEYEDKKRIAEFFNFE